MATIHDLPITKKYDRKQVAAITFEAHDPAQKAIPTSREWATDANRLYLGLGAANSVLCMSKEDLMQLLSLGDADGFLESLTATLQHAAKGFEHFKAFCEAAEARVYVAGESVVQDWPADA